MALQPSPQKRREIAPGKFARQKDSKRCHYRAWVSFASGNRLCATGWRLNAETFWGVLSSQGEYCLHRLPHVNPLI